MEAIRLLEKRKMILRFVVGFAWLAMIPYLSGCASLAKGVTQAMMESGAKKEDTRQCFIKGPPFGGLESYMKRQEQFRQSQAGDSDFPLLKVLVVHGIGGFVPGHAVRLAQNLARALGLDVTERDYKQFTLAVPKELIRNELDPTKWSQPTEELGQLRLTRFVNTARKREMLFYELTWSPITDPLKEKLAYDQSGEYTHRRTALNNQMKMFMTQYSVDPLLFLGDSRQKILVSVTQSLCWMFETDWDEFEDGGSRFCRFEHPNFIEDDYAIISHSLGSRVVIDSLQRVTDLISREEAFRDHVLVLQNKSIPLFMLSNQLPLFQVAGAKPKVHGQIPEHCGLRGSKYQERFLKGLAIVAFSDPNDILSYGIPERFVDENLDSRLCPTLANVLINVADPIDLFGLGEIASPCAAHREYEGDERIIALIVRGVGNEHTSEIITKRCEWLRTK